MAARRRKDPKVLLEDKIATPFGDYRTYRTIEGWYAEAPGAKRPLHPDPVGSFRRIRAAVTADVATRQGSNKVVHGQAIRSRVVKSRRTGTSTHLEDAEHPDVRDNWEPGKRWVLVCVTHGTSVRVGSLQGARIEQVKVDEWCPKCAKLPWFFPQERNLSTKTEVRVLDAQHRKVRKLYPDLNPEAGRWVAQCVTHGQTKAFPADQFLAAGEAVVHPEDFCPPCAERKERLAVERAGRASE